MPPRDSETHELRVTEVSPGRNRIDAADSHVFICQEDDPKELPQRFTDRRSGSCLVVEFLYLDLLKRVLTTIHGDALDDGVDNDHGQVMNLADFVQRMESDPAWDWRAV